MKRLLTILPFVALVVAACGSDDDSGVEVDDAWARATAEGQTTGAVYFEITAAADDRLVAASVPATVAAVAEIHEVVMADDGDAGTDMGEGSGDAGTDMGEESGDDGMDMGDDTGAEPQMRMQELVDGLALPAGETVTFEPGGYHVMLLDLAEPLEVGDEVELTLDLETAADVTVVVAVAESAP